MRYLDEMSVGEIADALDVSYKTAESLLSRGRSGLRRAYGGIDDE
jgi:DNA-directed RNA polymerase specialized sigma24 family protein